MTVAERLRRLCGVGLHEAPVAVGKVQHEVVDGLLHSVDDRLGLAEVALGISGRMGQRNVHLPCPAATLAHVVLDYRVLAVEAVLGSQALVDPPTATEAVRPAQTASDVAEGSRPRSTAANPPNRCNLCGRFVPREGPWPCTYYDSYTGGWEHE